MKIINNLGESETSELIEHNAELNDSAISIKNKQEHENLLKELNNYESLIKNAKSLGENAISGEATMLPMLLDLEILNDYGALTLPLNENIAEKLIKICKQAPYGFNHETLINKEVRDTFQLEPSSFEIKNPEWNEGLKKLVNENVAKGLGCHGEIEAKLYKLLVYQAGGHFKKVFFLN
jgi:hypothetical protein